LKGELEPVTLGTGNLHLNAATDFMPRRISEKSIGIDIVF
jgi:hypothetical protein